MARTVARATLEAGSDTDGYRLSRKIADALALLSGRVPGGGSYFLPMRVAEWTGQNVPAAATVATVTRAADGAGTRHYVTGVSGSYSAAQAGTMRLLAGGTVLATFHVHNFRDGEFASPVEIPPNTAVTLELSAGAAGVVGAVMLRGYTVAE